MSGDVITARIGASKAAEILKLSTASVYLYVAQGRLTNVSTIPGKVELLTTEVVNFKRRSRGRQSGYVKAQPKYPRQQRYYQRKRGKHGGKQETS